MHSGQMLQTIGALALLSLLVMNANRAVLGNSRTVYTGQYISVATQIAQSYILDATTKEFDENAIGRAPIHDQTLFSVHLGTDGGEADSTLSTFDDIDDYNGYHASYITPYDTVHYYVRCVVEYVSPNNFSVVSGSQTFYKRISVTVNVPYADYDLVGGTGGVPQITLRSVVSYH